MKNINAIKTFMQENGVHFEEEFYVDFGEKQEIFNINNFKKFSISQDDEEFYFTNDSGEEISCEEIGNILFNDDVHVITKNYFETMMKYYISISKYVMILIIMKQNVLNALYGHVMMDVFL